ncbi:MAG: hypothetical protein ACXVZW_10405 [Gaiellaceae bacterium]
MAFSVHTDEELAAQVAQARERLAAGDVGKAKALLEHVVYNTHDPELLGQIHELGQEGLAKSGRFGKSAWKHIITTSALGLEGASTRNGDGEVLSE